MVGFGAERVDRFGVPNHEVGVAARSDFSLARIHPENARGRGGSDLHKTVEGNLSRVDAVVVDQLQAVLNARSAVRNLGEIILAQNFLIGKAERAVVR